MIKHTLYQTANFELVESASTGVNDTHFEKLEVISHGLAEKHVVEIRLDGTSPRFEGKPVRYKYTGAEVSHGMRCRRDSLDETREYIGVLTEAVIFIDNTIDMIRNW